MTEAERILKSLPSEYPFEFLMNADSTVEVWTDIPTKLGSFEAWHVVGARYTFQNVNPTVPFLLDDQSAPFAAELQIHRNDDSELLLPANDPVVIGRDAFDFTWATSVGYQFKRAFDQIVNMNTIVCGQMLRVLFRTSVDVPIGLSAATVCVRGTLFYHLVGAPDNGRTKIGIPLDEI